MNILVGLSPKTTTMRHLDCTAMRPLEGTMLLKGAAFSSNCSATNVVDFAAAIMPPRESKAASGLHSWVRLLHAST